MDKSVITQEELENVAKVYDRIRALYRKKLPEQDTPIAEAFENHIKNLMYEFTQQSQRDLPYHILEGHAIQTKFKMYKLCVEKSVHLTKAYDAKLGNILAHIYKELGGLFDMIAVNYFSVCENVVEKNEELVKTKQENADILEAAETMEKEIIQIRSQRDEYKDLVESEVQSNPEIQQLQAENRRYLDKIIQLSKGNAEAILRNSPSPSKRAVTAAAKKTVGPARMSVTPTPRSTAVKNLTLKQLKDTIEEIYTSKQRYDQKCQETNAARETMSQHIGTFLNQKYGLKSIQADWTTAIMKGITKFVAEDSDVALFNAIISNEVDEDYRQLQVQMKSTIHDLLTMHLKAKFPTKGEVFIKQALAERTAGDIEADEWEDILQNMYSQDDMEYIKGVITDHLNEKYEQELSEVKKLKRSKSAIEALKVDLSYNDFVYFLLEFQLKGYQKCLEPFLNQFKEVDVDNDGVINVDEFATMIEAFSFGDSSEKLIQLVEQGTVEYLTMTDVVAMLNNEEYEDNVTYLQKLMNNQ